MVKKIQDIKFNPKNISKNAFFVLAFSASLSAESVYASVFDVKLIKTEAPQRSDIASLSKGRLQTRELRGKVVGLNGLPLRGVSVIIKGSTIGTTSDKEGNFSLNLPSGNSATLVLRFVGYKDKEVVVQVSSNNISVELQEDENTLDEVVVVGYGSQKKAVVSGAIASVKGEDLAKSPSVNLSNSFAGRLPGVTAMQSSGEPGGDGSTIRIRGINSLSCG